MLVDNNQIGWAYVNAQGEVLETNATPYLVCLNKCGQESYGLFDGELGRAVVLLPFSKERQKVIVDESTLDAIRELNCSGSFATDGEQASINLLYRNCSGLEGITRLIKGNNGFVHNISNTQECGRGL